MRLRTFESFWLLKNGLLHTYPSLQRHMKTEIVVIGGGITGALISHQLLEDGYQVALIDRRDIGQGSSSATTSMLQYEIDEMLVDLSEKIGEEGAALCYNAGIEAINKLRQLVKSQKIDCGFAMKKSLYIAHSKPMQKKLEKEFALRKKYKLGVQWLNATEIKKDYGLESFGGILSDTAASMDAYKFAHELIAHNTQRGLSVYDQTEIKSYQSRPRSVLLTTEEGVEISCRKVIFCNGFESTEWLKEKICALLYTYATVSEPAPSIPEKLIDTLVWNTSDPYLYMRTTDDGRLLVGGEDEAFKPAVALQKKKEEKSKKLQKALKKILPRTPFIEDFSWGGVFGSTDDGLPYIGASPEWDHALFVLGFGGNGITFSVQGMEIISDMLSGKENPLAHYYRFGR